MPEDGVKLKSHDDIMSFEDIVRVVTSAASMGISKIRLTGGEPLVRKGIVDLVKMISGIQGIGELAITTNGTLLAPLAVKLKEAGLDRINISLDTLDRDEYARLTRGGKLEDALAGVDAAISAGLPVKINMVRPPNATERELEDMRAFCERKGIKLQLIRQYELTENKEDDISYDRPSPCEECNRIRLLADGTLKPCLHSDKEIDLDMSDIDESLAKAVRAKPARGTVCTGRNILQIGG